MKRILTGIFLLAALSMASTGTAFAQEPTPITGTVQSVTFGTDPDKGETYAIVTLENADGTTTTINMTMKAADAYGFVDSSSGTPAANEDSYGTEVTIEPADILPDTTEGGEEEEAEHPVGSALSDFFSDLLGVEYDTVMTAHEDGVGFGVIAQALWMTNQLGGGTEEFEALIEAKKTGDYSNITLADGSTPDNWGDVVQGLKKGENLGSVMSGKAEAEATPTPEATTPDSTTSSTNGNGNGNGNGNAGGNGNGNGNGNAGGNGGGNGNGNNSSNNSRGQSSNAGGNGNGNGGNGNGNGGGNGNNDDDGDGDSGNGKGKGKDKGKP